MNDRGMKKFNPFKSLMGQEDYVKQEEEDYISETNSIPEISEYQMEELNLTLSQIEKDTYVLVTYYNRGVIIKEKGYATKYNDHLKINNKKIYFTNLLDIRIIEEF